MDGTAVSATGHIKRDPITGAVAIRTHFDETNPQLAAMAWQIATVNVGPRSAASAEVDGWDDLYVPEAGA